MSDIARIPKNYFSLKDIAKISTLTEGSLGVALSRLVKQGRLMKLARGWYTRDIAQVNIEQFALDVYPGSYLSFESVLAAHGVLSQQPFALTCATRKPRKSLVVGGRRIVYRHLQSGMFWGYRKIGQVLEAEPEKALLDLAHLSLRGYAKFDPEEMNGEFLERKKIRAYLKKAHSQKLTRLIENVFESKN